MKNTVWTILGSFVVAAFLVAFQNCSETKFTAASQGSASAGSVDGGPDGRGGPVIEGGKDVEEVFNASTKTNINKVDVLFVLDESVSMNSIIVNVQAGFRSLSAAAYPADTKMAVTNMAPAYYTAPGQFDVTRAFVSKTYIPIPAQPGFLRLVNKDSLGSFRTAFPSQSTSMTLTGCAQSWFEPTERDVANTSCLEGATQIVRQATGVEAGLVSLSQLAERTLGSGSRLFREGSLVNVIFVSDTHDAGFQAYYGSVGAPAQIISPTALRDRLYAINPGIEGLRFNAITPLPPAGDARIAGIQVIGALPANLTESKIGNEDLHDFSYLPFVRDSGGVAMHAERSDWASAIAAMVVDLTKRRNPVVNLSRNAAKILSVSVQGTVLSSSEYSLYNGNRVEIIGRSAWPATVEVRVAYTPL